MRMTPILAVFLPLTLLSTLAAAQEPAGTETPATPEVVTLAQAVEIALRQNFGAREARASAAEARAQAGVAATAFLPRFSASVGASGYRQFLNPDYVLPVDPNIDLTGTSYSTSVDMSYALLTSTRRLNWQQSKLNAEASQLSYEATRRKLIRDVAMAYLDVLEADSQARLAGEDLKRRQNGRNEAAELAKAGRRAQYEVLQAEAEEAAAAARNVAATNKKRVSRAVLAHILGQPLHFDVGVKMPDKPEAPQAKAFDPELAATVARKRPEGRMSQATAQAAVLAHRASKRSYFPTLGLFAGYRRDLDPSNTQITIESLDYGASLSVAFSDQAATLWRVRAARASEERQAAAADVIRTDLLAAAQNAILDHEGAIEDFDARKRARDAARRAFEVAVERYRLGVASQTDRIAAEATLAQAESDYTTSEINLSRSIWELRYALGETMEVPQ